MFHVLSGLTTLLSLCRKSSVLISENAKTAAAWLSNETTSSNPNMAHQHANHRNYHLCQSIWLHSRHTEKSLACGFWTGVSTGACLFNLQDHTKSFRPLIS